MSGVFERFAGKCRKEARAEGFAKGFAEGFAEGRAIGHFEVRLEILKAVIRNFGLSKEQAMEQLEIPIKDREQLSLQL